MKLIVLCVDFDLEWVSDYPFCVSRSPLQSTHTNVLFVQNQSILCVLEMRRKRRKNVVSHEKEIYYAKSSV